VTFTARPPYPRGNNYQCLLDRWPDRLKGQFGYYGVEENVPPSPANVRVVVRQASPQCDPAIPAREIFLDLQYLYDRL